MSKKIIIAPDSFKGTMSAKEVCSIISERILAIDPETRIVCVPMSDGGEGMVEAYAERLGGKLGFIPVTGPKLTEVNCPYAILPDGTAVMEMAGAAGLPLMGNKLDPLGAVTTGVGEAIKSLANMGCEKLLMGLGGSATNDCGIGMAYALGYRFFDENGTELEARAFNLSRVEHIVPPEKKLEISVTAACDVSNPLCGEKGSAAVFGPQKGLQPEQIKPHNDAMAHFAQIIKKDLGLDVADMPGAGAAGGLGAGVVAFLGAALTPGIEMLLDTVNFDALARDADLIITGEGRLDGQSTAGKVPVGVAGRAKKAGVPCIALCGCLGKDADKALEYGISACYGATEEGRAMDELVKTCRNDLAVLTDSVMKNYI